MSDTPNPTEIIIIVDRSGSMNRLWSDTVGGLRTAFANWQKELPHAKVTLVTFNNISMTHYNGEVMATLDLETVSSKLPYPDGNTALWRTVAETIDRKGADFAKYPQAIRDRLKVYCCIVTDGLENASTGWTADMVRHRIERQTGAYGWVFNYLGANQDAMLAGEAMGIQREFAADYAANKVGVEQVYEKMSGKAMFAAAGNIRGCSYSVQEREELQGSNAQNP